MYSPNSWDITSSDCSIESEGYSDAKFTAIFDFQRSVESHNIFWNASSKVTCLISALDYEWECLFNETEHSASIHMVNGSLQWFEPLEKFTGYQSAILDTIKNTTSSWY